MKRKTIILHPHLTSPLQGAGFTSRRPSRERYKASLPWWPATSSVESEGFEGGGKIAILPLTAVIKISFEKENGIGL